MPSLRSCPEKRIALMSYMRGLPIAATAALLLAVSAVTSHADEVTGRITSINPDLGTVTLDDGNIYLLPSSDQVGLLVVGQQVTITFEERDDGMLIASKLTTET
jgi:hypothetical protein